MRLSLRHLLDRVPQPERAARRGTLLPTRPVLVDHAERVGRERAVSTLAAGGLGLVGLRAGRARAEVGAGIRDVDPPGGVGRAGAETEYALDEAEVRDAVGERVPVGGVDA